MTLPDPTILPRILFGMERGIVRHAPWLALGALGLLRMLRARPLRSEGLLCLFLVAFYLALNCAQTKTPDDWRGGAGIGARYLVPSVPFYVLAMVGLIVPPMALWKRVRPLRIAAVAAFALLVAVSGSRMFVGTAVHAEPNKKDDPFGEYLFPLWWQDRVSISTVPFHAGNNDPKHAWNLGEKLFGLEGRASLLPLAVFALVACAFLLSTMWTTSTRPERTG